MRCNLENQTVEHLPPEYSENFLGLLSVDVNQKKKLSDFHKETKRWHVVSSKWLGKLLILSV